MYLRIIKSECINKDGILYLYAKKRVLTKENWKIKISTETKGMLKV